MARRTIDFGALVIPDRVGRDVTESVDWHDAGEICRDVNNEGFFLGIPDQENKLTIEYSGRGDWAAPALEGLKKGDIVTVQLCGWNKQGIRRPATCLVAAVRTAFQTKEQTLDWTLRLVEV